MHQNKQKQVYQQIEIFKHKYGIIGIRGKKLELLAFLDFHQPQIVAIQEAPRDIAILEWETNNIKIKNPVYHIFFVETVSL